MAFGLPRLFGRQKSAGASAPGSARQWVTLFENVPGGWQRDAKVSREDTESYPPIFRARSLIAGDIGKIRQTLKRTDSDGIPVEVTSRRTPYLAVLANPCPWCDDQQFRELMIGGLLDHGNAYALKERDSTNTVRRLWPIDPRFVQVRIAPGGKVFYAIVGDDMLPDSSRNVVIPASEIMHLRWNTIHHPMIGVPPLWSAALTGRMGVSIQKQSETFFANQSAPSGLLMGDDVDEAEAEELTSKWNAGYSGDKRGRVAVLGGGLKFVPLTMPSRDAQLSEQLEMTAKMVGVAYGVSEWKMGLTPPPSFPNAVSTLNQIYYADTLHRPIRIYEKGMTQALELPTDMCVELREEDLLRMDQQSQMATLSDGVSSNILMRNEARRALGRKPVDGGDQLFRQMQDVPLNAPVAPVEVVTPEIVEDEQRALPAPADLDVARLADLTRKALA